MSRGFTPSCRGPGGAAADGVAGTEAAGHQEPLDVERWLPVGGTCAFWSLRGWEVSY